MPLSIYDQQNLTSQQQTAVSYYQGEYADAQARGDTAAMASAHAAAEQVRSTAGYSGGGDGSKYIPLGRDVQPTVPNYVLQSATSANGQINAYNQAYIESATQALKSAYEENVNTINATAQKIPGIYQDARNQSAASGELSRKNFNEYASASGLSSGTGGQAQLAMSNKMQANLSNIDRGEADTTSSLELQRTQLETKYKNDIAQAIATGNLQKAQMLYEDYVRVDNSLVETSLNQARLGLDTYGMREDSYRYDQTTQQQQAVLKAETLAAYGDFSGYKALGYTEEEIAAMTKRYQEMYALGYGNGTIV